MLPSTVLISPTHLVSTMRRRRDPIERSYNWIDVYESTDSGVSWNLLSKVADTDDGKKNGNPPSMIRLKDSRLVVTYGYRSSPMGFGPR